jgi:hypothetical protein
MKYLIYAILLVVATTSCNWIQKKAPNETALLDEEISKINWELVDEPAGLILCDSLKNMDEKEVCLQQTLKEHLQNSLTQKIIETIDLNVDSILVAITINPDSTISIIPDVGSIDNEQSQQNILQTLTENVGNLPKAYPAIKRGMPVKTQMQIPVKFVK